MTRSGRSAPRSRSQPNCSISSWQTSATKSKTWRMSPSIMSPRRVTCQDSRGISALSSVGAGRSSGTMHRIAAVPNCDRLRRISSASLPLAYSPASGVKVTDQPGSRSAAGALRSASASAVSPKSKDRPMGANSTSSSVGMPPSPKRASSAVRTSSVPAGSASPSRVARTMSCNTSAATKNSLIASGVRSSRPERTSSMTVSKRWEKATSPSSPKAPAPPLMEWTARKTTLIVSESCAPSSMMLSAS